MLLFEETYAEALRTATMIEGNAQALLLQGPDGELRYSRIAELDTSKVVDRVWTLEGLIAGGTATPPQGEPATLELRSDGTFTAGTGCRTFTGRYIVVGDEIRFTENGADVEDECPEDLWEQDAQVLSALGGGPVVIEGDRLTVTERGGNGLLYRAS